MGQRRRGLELRLLGSLEVAVDGRAVEIGSPKQQALLVALALEPCSVVSRERLVEALWGDKPPDSAHPTLRGLVSRLRRTLTAAGDGNGATRLRGKGSGYVLELGPEEIDAARFKRLAGTGREALAQGDPTRAAEILGEALALWRGPALGDFSDWLLARSEAFRLDEARLDAIEDLADAELGLGRPGDALRRLESHVEGHPLRERAWEQLMLALYRLGRQADALRTYQRVRYVLAQELGIEPAPGLREMESRILRQCPGLLIDEPTSQRPATAPQIPRHNLPVALTSFVGRAQEIDEIASLIGHFRLVTLAGPGGAGKTRLALEAAAVAGEDFRDGVWLVELAPLRDPDLVAYVLATALGLDPSALAGSGRPFEEALCDQLRYRRLLIVLDNCEHLVVVCARLTHAILRHCANIVVLATSREVLAVPGERVVRVGPLSLPPRETADRRDLVSSDAVALFCERARESAPGFALDEANAAAIAQICRQLDGMPLALELAAARMRVLGAETLAEGLDDRFRLLSKGPRTVDPRHRTLQAAIDWSYELLSEAERVVLRRLAVFPATFGLEAAGAVVAGAGEIDGPESHEMLDIVDRLADKSLLAPSRDGTSEVRYRLLETVRQYAAGKLAGAGETIAAHERHRDFFTSASQGWFLEVTDGHRLRWAETETDNLRAALQWSRIHDDGVAILRLATPLWLFWLFSGTADASDWLERAVAAPGSEDVSLRVHARIGLALVLRNLDADEKGRSAHLISDALALAVGHGDEPAAAWARFQLAELAAIDGRHDEHERLVAQATEAFRSTGQAVGEAYACGVLAWGSMLHGDLAEARAGLERGLSLLGDNADNYLLPHILGLLALAQAASGDAPRAEGTAAAGVRAARAFPGRQILVMALTRATETAVISGRSEAASTFLDELLRLLRDLGARRWVAETLELAAVVFAPGRPEAAATVLGTAGALRGALREQGSGLPGLSQRLSACETAVTASLGGSRAAECKRVGTTMHLAEVLTYALAHLRGEAVPRNQDQAASAPGRVVPSNGVAEMVARLFRTDRPT